MVCRGVRRSPVISRSLIIMLVDSNIAARPSRWLSRRCCSARKGLSRRTSLNQVARSQLHNSLTFALTAICGGEVALRFGSEAMRPSRRDRSRRVRGRPRLIVARYQTVQLLPMAVRSGSCPFTGIYDLQRSKDSPFSAWPDSATRIEGLNGIVMYGRPRCCKGETDLKRR